MCTSKQSFLTKIFMRKFSKTPLASSWQNHLRIAGSIILKLSNRKCCLSIRHLSITKGPRPLSLDPFCIFINSVISIFVRLGLSVILRIRIKCIVVIYDHSSFVLIALENILRVHLIISVLHSSDKINL